jgi:hypothetical protein
VSVQSDDPAAVTEALIWAKKTWGQLVRLPGKGVPALPSEGQEPSNESPHSSNDEEPPICAVHHLPMVHVQSEKGAFWSCHQKNSNGSWCNYRPQGL